MTELSQHSTACSWQQLIAEEVCMHAQKAKLAKYTSGTLSYVPFALSFICAK